MKHFWIVFILISSLSFAQKAPVKFGKVSEEELLQTRYDADTNCHAFYICDYGFTEFRYANTLVKSNDAQSQSKGFQVFYERQFRLKILDKTGISNASFEIFLRKQGSQFTETVMDIDAVTYNFENGKVEKSKLKNDGIFRDEHSKYLDICKFALPNVKAGSVIEVKYLIRSDYTYSLRDWEFQYDLPVKHSEYHIWIPEYYSYNKAIKGYIPVRTTSDSKSENLTITYEEKAEGISKAGGIYTSSFDFTSYLNSYFADNVPAFYDEVFLSSPENYTSKLVSEISFVKFPRQAIEYFTNTWESICNDLMKDSEFGDFLGKDKHLADLARELTSEPADLLSKAAKCHRLIQKQMQWDNKRGIWMTSLKKPFETRIGSVAEINMNLVNLMRLAGIEAFPVILSTRDNGFIHPSHPSLAQMNYMIAAARVDGKYFLFDATDSLCTTNILPTRALNDKGRVILDSKNSEWVDLQNNKMEKIQVSYDLILNPDGSLTGKMIRSYDDYGAYFRRLDIYNYNGSEGFVKNLQDANPGLQIDKWEIQNLSMLNNKLIENYEIKISNIVEQTDSALFFDPLLFEKLNENPLKREERVYPVEMLTPSMKMVTIKISLPDGFSVASLPKVQIAALPDKSAKISYNSGSVGNILSITFISSINKTLFLPDEYKNLREFFSVSLQKQSEKVVLKKL